MPYAVCRTRLTYAVWNIALSHYKNNECVHTLTTSCVCEPTSRVTRLSSIRHETVVIFFSFFLLLFSTVTHSEYVPNLHITRFYASCRPTLCLSDVLNVYNLEEGRDGGGGVRDSVLENGESLQCCHNDAYDPRLYNYCKSRSFITFKSIVWWCIADLAISSYLDPWVEKKHFEVI